MRTTRLLSIASIVLFAGCTEQVATGPGTPRLKPTDANFATYVATPSAAVILGSWSGSSYTIAYDINDLGVITGVSNLSINAVRWETGTAAAPASTTALLVDGGAKIGRAINAAGQIAGENVTHAGLWTPDGVGGYTLTDIGADPLFALGSVAYGLSADGKVVGSYRAQVGTDFVDKCFLWTPTSPNATTGSAVELIGLGGNFCVANDINAIGQIAGTSVDPVSGFNHATVWTGGNLQGIDLQPGPDESYGASINNAGQVAGFHSATSRNAAIWTPSGSGWSTATDLVAPAFSGQSGVITSQALDINDAGFVVGETEDATLPIPNIRAFFWQSGIFTELPNPGVSVSEATALTDAIGNLVLVSGGDLFDVPNNSRHGLRWSVTLTPSSPAGCLAQLTQLVTDLRNANVLNTGEARSLLGKVDAATRQASQGKATPAKNVLSALINEANALSTSGRLTSAQAQELIDAALCAIAAL